MESIAARLRGKFVVLDGPDGSGKSTQHKRLEDALLTSGVEVQSCRDPGGTAIGDRIRSVLLDFDLSTMNVNCETMLFMASRSQLAAEVIRPALARGAAVLCDRFASSTCAYQGAAGYDPLRVIELARYALDNLWPDVTIVLDIDPEIGFSRIGRKPRHAGRNRSVPTDQSELFSGVKPDAMEARPLEFHRRVRRLFLDLPSYYPKPVIVVDANADPDTVYNRIVEALSHALV